MLRGRYTVYKRLDLKLIKIDRITPPLVPEFLDWILGASFIKQLAKPGIPMELTRMLRAALKPQGAASVHTCHAVVSNGTLFLSLYLAITHRLSQADLLLTKRIMIIGMLCSY